MWGCCCEQFSTTQNKFVLQRAQGGKVRAHIYFFVGIYVFLAALLLWIHLCQLIDPDLACWLSPLDSEKVLLQYIRSHDKMYSSVPLLRACPGFCGYIMSCAFFSIHLFCLSLLLLFLSQHLCLSSPSCSASD